MDFILYTALWMLLIAFASARSIGSMDQHALRLNDEAEQEMDALVEETRQLNEEIEDTAPEFGDLESKFNSLRPFKNKAQHRQDAQMLRCRDAEMHHCGKCIKWKCETYVRSGAYGQCIRKGEANKCKDFDCFCAKQCECKPNDYGGRAKAQAQEIGGEIKNGLGVQQRQASDEAKKVGGKIKDALVVF